MYKIATLPAVARDDSEEEAPMHGAGMQKTEHTA